MLRATNTGATVVIDHHGVVTTVLRRTPAACSKPRCRAAATRRSRLRPALLWLWPLLVARGGGLAARGGGPLKSRVRSSAARPMLTASSKSSSACKYYWDRQGCALLQPMTWKSAPAPAHRHLPARDRPPGLENRLRCHPAAAQGQPLRREPQPHAALPSTRVVLKPAPANILELTSARWRPGLRPEEERRALRRGRLGEPDLGCWGLGWEVWLNGMGHAVHLLPAGSAASTASPSPARSPTASSAWRCTCRAWTTSTTCSTAPDDQYGDVSCPERGRAEHLQLRAPTSTSCSEAFGP